MRVTSLVRARRMLKTAGSELTRASLVTSRRAHAGDPDQATPTQTKSTPPRHTKAGPPLRATPLSYYRCYLLAGGGQVGRDRPGADRGGGVDACADGLLTGLGGEHELAVLEVDVHVVTGVEVTLQDALAQPVLDLVLNRTAQGAGTESRVEPDLDEVLLGRNGQLDGHVAVEQTSRQPLDEQVDDLEELGLVQLREHD